MSPLVLLNPESRVTPSLDIPGCPFSPSTSPLDPESQAIWTSIQDLASSPAQRLSLANVPVSRDSPLAPRALVLASAHLASPDSAFFLSETSPCGALRTVLGTPTPAVPMLRHAHQALRRCPISVPTPPSRSPAWSRCSLRPAQWGCRNAYSGGLTGWLSRLEEDHISGGPALLPHQHPIPQGSLGPYPALSDCLSSTPQSCCSTLPRPLYSL